MEHLSISQARSRLTQLATKIQRDQEPVEVTNHGKPVLAILSWDLYEAMEETIEILSDDQLMKRLHQGMKEMSQGKFLSWEKVKKEL